MNISFVIDFAFPPFFLFTLKFSSNIDLDIQVFFGVLFEAVVNFQYYTLSIMRLLGRLLRGTKRKQSVRNNHIFGANTQQVHKTGGRLVKEPKT